MLVLKFTKNEPEVYHSCVLGQEPHGEWRLWWEGHLEQTQNHRGSVLHELPWCHPRPRNLCPRGSHAHVFLTPLPRGSDAKLPWEVPTRAMDGTCSVWTSSPKYFFSRKIFRKTEFQAILPSKHTQSATPLSFQLISPVMDLPVSSSQHGGGVRWLKQRIPTEGHS